MSADVVPITPEIEARRETQIAVQLAKSLLQVRHDRLQELLDRAQRSQRVDDWRELSTAITRMHEALDSVKPLLANKI